MLRRRSELCWRKLQCGQKGSSRIAPNNIHWRSVIKILVDKLPSIQPFLGTQLPKQWTMRESLPHTASLVHSHQVLGHLSLSLSLKPSVSPSPHFLAPQSFPSAFSILGKPVGFILDLLQMHKKCGRRATPEFQRKGGGIWVKRA